ncbi:hypothetical protein EJ06DRAFT_529889 [Trichodelitschia bisporula]|uniref:USP domain-containing protein n=1 Tax=Trichodelitschia bisporula TaxID=703511 RepID=A0A6G1HXQ4_9PEZI|nr:hypothetical protein EJ06DRAFT_529889 [Trichodelitschia bisporula]
MPTDNRGRTSRAPSSEPSTVQRDATQDADDSQTRKRPRLDSGSHTVRSQSADQVLFSSPRLSAREFPMDDTMKAQTASPSDKQPVQTPSKITINLRAPHRMDDPDPQSLSSMDVPSPTSSLYADAIIGPDLNGMSNDDESLRQRESSSPVVEIDPPEPEEMDDGAAAGIEIDGLDQDQDQDDPVTYAIYTFPYQKDGDYMSAMNLILHHLDNDSIEINVLTEIRNWLNVQYECFAERPLECWSSLYLGHSALWDNIGKIMQRLLSRTESLGDYGASQVRTVVLGLLRSYVMLVTRLLQVDLQTLRETGATPVPERLLSIRHLKIMATIFDDSNQFITNVVNLESKEYVERLWVDLLHVFICPPTDGLAHLSRFVSALCEGLSSNERLAPKLPPTVRLASFLTRVALVAKRSTNEVLARDWAPYIQHLQQIYYDVRSQLNERLNKQDPLRVEIRRDIVDSLAVMIQTLGDIDPAFSERMFVEMAGQAEPSLQAHYPFLIGMMWKLKLMMTYVSKGRMDLRILGMETMQHELVQAYTAYNTSAGANSTARLSPVHEVLVFLAQMLLDSKLAEYIVGVESHPQLISRSNNVIGFLVVTDKFSSQQADLIWQTVISSQDPRVVNATLTLLQYLINSLTKHAEDIYLCRKLLDAPLPTFTAEAASFFEAFVCKLERDYVGLSSDADLNEAPLKFCIRLISDSFSAPVITPPLVNVRGHAAVALSRMTTNTVPAVRHSLYRSCTVTVQKGGAEAASTMYAIHEVLKAAREDIGYLIQDLDLACILVDEFGRFLAHVEEAGHQDIMRLKLFLGARIDLLIFLLTMEPEALSDGKLKVFWDLLGGSSAVRAEAREITWQRLSTLAMQRQQKHPLVERCYVEYLPTVPPEQYTATFFDCLQHACSNIRRTDSRSSLSDGSIVEIPSIDLVWRVMLNAPPHTDEEALMRFIVGAYLDISLVRRFTKEILENTHASVVRRCLGILDPAFTHLRSASPLQQQSEDVPMADHSPEPQCSYERLFARTLRFLTVFLNQIGTRPEFFTLPKPAVAGPPAEEKPSSCKGHPVTISYQVMRTGAQHGEVMKMAVGDLETCVELHRRLKWAFARLGLTSFKLIWGGTYIRLLDKPTCTLRDIGVNQKGLLLVKESPNDAGAEPIMPIYQARTTFEREIMDHFDDFYKYMDGKDGISQATYTFLEMFPLPDSMSALIADPEVDISRVFPQGQIFKIHYSLRCLHFLLSDQLRSSSIDEQFIRHGIRLLESVLSSDEIFSLQHDVQHLEVGAAAAEYLLGYLQEYSAPEDPFSNGEALLLRVPAILQLSCDTRSRRAIRDSYDLLLNVALCSAPAWNAFSHHELLFPLHHKLLLEDADPVVRQQTAQAMTLRLAGFPGKPYLAVSEFASFFWDIFERLIPRAIDYPQRCGDMLVIANQLLGGRVSEIPDATLRSYFSQWSKLLLDHRHIEFVGRDEKDEIICGLANLLRTCYSNIPEASDEVPTDELARSIWEKFLFPHPVPDRKDFKDYYDLTQDEEEIEEVIPALENSTRSALYILLYTMSDSHKNQRRMLGYVEHTDLCFDYARVWSIDNTKLLRAPCGYVGVKNLGNTCYMNALVTQLFMNPGFRTFFFNCEPAVGQRNSKLLTETRRLFAHMQDAYERSSDTAEFTRHITNLGNEVINVAEQMDVDEFLNILFIRWEEQMPSEVAKKKFRSFYGGKTIQQIKSKECDHVSEREDACLAIQCDVQGKSTLQDSLQAFVDGDVMEGDNKYKCEPCGKLVDAVKRTCLKQVPDHLIFHLKRFEFDLGLMRRSKINDLFEFPMTIDISPYTVDHITDPSTPTAADVFDLVGVVVHKGAADHGHYVSYIRVRPNADNEPTWLLFDDADVTTFDPTHIPDSCYGGFAAGKDTMHFQSTAKMFNAYMLFYQRRSSLDLKPDGMVVSPSSPPTAPIPAEFKTEISRENADLLRDYCLFNDTHHRYILETLKKITSLDHDENEHHLQSEFVEVACHSMWLVVARIKDTPELDSYVEEFAKLFPNCRRCTAAALNYYEKHGNEMRDFLIRCTTGKVRNCIRSLLLHALRCLRSYPELYGVDTADGELDTQGMKDRGLLQNLMSRLWASTDEDLHLNSRSWDDYFGFLVDFAQLGQAEASQMIYSGILQTCIELLCANGEDQLRVKYAKILRWSERRTQPSYEQMMRLLCILLPHVDMDRTVRDEFERADHYDSQTKLLPLIADEQGYLRLWNSEDNTLWWLVALIEKWDCHGEQLSVPGEILRLVLRTRKDSKFLELIARTFREIIENYTPQYADPFARVLAFFCAHCARDDLVRSLMDSMNRVTGAGDPHFIKAACEFYSVLPEAEKRRTETPDLDGSIISTGFLEGMPIWAPRLLIDRDNNVAKEIARTIKTYVFDGPITTSEYEFLRSRAVRSLFDRCHAQIKYHLEVQTPKSLLYWVLKVATRCYLYLQAINADDQFKDLCFESDLNKLTSFSYLTAELESTVQPQEDELAQSNVGSEFSDPSDDDGGA